MGSSDSEEQQDWEDHPDWHEHSTGAGYEGEEPIQIDGAMRHGLIISSTFPAFLVMAIFFALRWVLISGDRADSFRETALAFLAVGVILGAINIVIRRKLSGE